MRKEIKLIVYSYLTPGLVAYIGSGWDIFYLGKPTTLLGTVAYIVIYAGFGIAVSVLAKFIDHLICNEKKK